MSDNRAITVRCIVCGILITGVVDDTGLVRPSDRARPHPDDPPKRGLCIPHSNEREATT